MSSQQTRQADGELDRQLAELLEVERFEPSEGFRAQAELRDPEIYRKADEDWRTWWASQAEQLHWFKPWDTVLDDAEPPFYKWFTGGRLNASYNCLDRHVLAGRGDR